MPGPKTSNQRAKVARPAKATKGDAMKRLAYWLSKRRGKLTRLLNRAIKHGRKKKAESLRNALTSLSR